MNKSNKPFIYQSLPEHLISNRFYSKEELLMDIKEFEKNVGIENIDFGGNFHVAYLWSMFFEKPLLSENDNKFGEKLQFYMKNCELPFFDIVPSTTPNTLTIYSGQEPDTESVNFIKLYNIATPVSGNDIIAKEKIWDIAYERNHRTIIFISSDLRIILRQTKEIH